MLFTDGYAAAAPTLRLAVREFHSSDDIRWLGLACRAAGNCGTTKRRYALAARHARRARDAGGLTRMPIALDYLAGLQVHAGAFGPAADLIDDADAISEATGHPHVSSSALMLAAWRGSESEIAEHVEASRREALNQRDGQQMTHTEYAAAVLYNGLGRYEEALVAARRAGEGEELMSWCVLPELIEAAARKLASVHSRERWPSDWRSEPRSATPSGPSGSRRGRSRS